MNNACKYLVFFLFLTTQSLFASETESTLPAVDPISSAYLLKLTVGLVFIVAIIFGLAWLMKKMHLTQHSQNGVIKIVSAMSIGQRDRLALIQVGDDQILLGLTPGRIVKLHNLSSRVEMDQADADDNNFADKFNQLLKRDKAHAD